MLCENSFVVVVVVVTWLRSLSRLLGVELVRLMHQADAETFACCIINRKRKSMGAKFTVRSASIQMENSPIMKKRETLIILLRSQQFENIGRRSEESFRYVSNQNVWKQRSNKIVSNDWMNRINKLFEEQEVFAPSEVVRPSSPSPPSPSPANEMN